MSHQEPLSKSLPASEEAARPLAVPVQILVHDQEAGRASNVRRVAINKGFVRFGTQTPAEQERVNFVHPLQQSNLSVNNFARAPQGHHADSNGAAGAPQLSSEYLQLLLQVQQHTQAAQKVNQLLSKLVPTYALVQGETPHQHLQ